MKFGVPSLRTIYKTGSRVMSKNQRLKFSGARPVPCPVAAPLIVSGRARNDPLVMLPSGTAEVFFKRTAELVPPGHTTHGMSTLPEAN
jgi:hypothetical protein